MMHTSLALAGGANPGPAEKAGSGEKEAAGLPRLLKFNREASNRVDRSHSTNPEAGLR
jgi:hypothetical protein